MVDKNTLVKVTNRGRERAGYSIPELGVRRQFTAHETKELPMEEIRALSYMPGGKYMLEHYLVVENPEVVDEILGEVQPEYNYSEADVRNLLLNGSLDQLLDCLDFAPAGVVDLVKTLAVELKLNDVEKRQAILDKTGFNVTSAIEINKETEEKDDQKDKDKTTRRAEPIKENSEEAEPQRRTTIPQYKVVES